MIESLLAQLTAVVGNACVYGDDVRGRQNYRRFEQRFLHPRRLFT